MIVVDAAAVLYNRAVRFDLVIRRVYIHDQFRGEAEVTLFLYKIIVWGLVI